MNARRSGIGDGRTQSTATVRDSDAAGVSTIDVNLTPCGARRAKLVCVDTAADPKLCPNHKDLAIHPIVPFANGV